MKPFGFKRAAIDSDASIQFFNFLAEAGKIRVSAEPALGPTPFNQLRFFRQGFDAGGRKRYPQNYFMRAKKLVTLLPQLGPYILFLFPTDFGNRTLDALLAAGKTDKTTSLIPKRGRKRQGL